MTIVPADTLDDLSDAGVESLIGTVVTSAGLTHAKMVDAAAIPTFASTGLGVSPVWHVFTIDTFGIAYTEKFGAVGDQRLRIDLAAMRTVDDGLAWAPADFVTQELTPVGTCARTVLRQTEDALAERGLSAFVGHELEFTVLDAQARPLPATMWAQYGLAGVLEHEGFARDLVMSLRRAGIELAQLHPEYGANQFEISLAPLRPVAAADQVVAARFVVGRVARRHNMRACFSPKPFADGVGNGAHQHFSLSGPDGPLFSGGSGPHGLSDPGAAAIAGVVAGLPDVQGVLSGSIVSGLRILPGFWAGAYACWGTENREAAVRVIAAAPANPLGANVEVKVVDPSANPYLASAAILGLAVDGIDAQRVLSPETVVDPASQSDEQRTVAGTVLLPTDQRDVIDALDASESARRLLGDDAVDALIAVRRYEIENFGMLAPEEIAERFRMAWSV